MGQRLVILRLGVVLDLCLHPMGLQHFVQSMGLFVSQGVAAAGDQIRRRQRLGIVNDLVKIHVRISGFVFVIRAPHGLGVQAKQPAVPHKGHRRGKQQRRQLHLRIHCVKGFAQLGTLHQHRAVCRQLPAGRVTGKHNIPHIAGILAAVVTNPAQRPGHILQLLVHRHIRHQSVVNIKNHIPPIRQSGAVVVVQPLFRIHPAAAVNVNDHRQLSTGLCIRRVQHI